MSSGLLDSVPRGKSKPVFQKVQGNEITPSSTQGTNTGSLSRTSFGRTSWTPEASASPHAAGSALAAGPALPVWTTWNEMRFNQAALELQRPVENKFKDDTPSSVGNRDFEYKVPRNIRLLDTLSEASGESSESSNLAFITISDRVSYEQPWDDAGDSDAMKREKADRNSQSWPRANGHARYSLIDMKKKHSKKAKDWENLEFGGSGDEEQQPPTPRMILKQLKDSGKSRGSNRSSNRSSRGSRSRHSIRNSQANSKSSSMKKRTARSSSREKVRIFPCQDPFSHVS